jgi:cytochrome c-type biogenesis protein CcmF
VILDGLGPAALAVALAGAGATVALSLVGRSRAAGRALGTTLLALTVALVLLTLALVTVDGSLVYVADHTSRATDWHYRLAGLWGGMAGSLLLWTWMATVWAVVAGRVVRSRLPGLARWAHVVCGAYLAVFCALLVLVSDPFDRLAVPALDGGGLNPVLLHPAMLYHPPLLYAGAVGLLVPFALAVAGLASGRSHSWLPIASRTAGVSLVLLSAGLLTGAHWAYVELGWGGYWAWDPVENGGLLPWLAGVAFLHAAVAARRRRGRATAAAGLAVLAFVLGLLGSFLTRSGASESVHAFAEARTVGWVLGAGLVAAVIPAVVLLVRRRRGGVRAAAPRLLGANNVVLVGLVVVIGFGTVFPVLARWLTGDRVVVTGRYFALVAAPLAVALLVMLGVGPRLGWRTTPPAEVRRRMRPAAVGLLTAAMGAVWFAEPRPVAIVLVGVAGAAAALTVAEWRRRPVARWPLAHVGVAVLLAGVAGTTTGTHVTTSLAPGQEVTVRGYTLRLVEVVPADAPDGGRAAEARMQLRRGADLLTTLRPVALVSATGQRVSVAALRSTPLTDVQVALRAVGEGGATAVVEIGVAPLMQLVWWGGLLVVAGLALTVAQSSRRAGTNVTENGDDAPNGSSPDTDASSTYAPPSSRSAVTLGTSGSTIQ